ncbi:hypothetical protein, partial [Rhodovulum sulfidophilum]|uniref:hypothetical protein n=1 Tax=Rhodovulum sulfidophilum TaxID=35806 RepID=UPI002224940F
CHWVAPLSAVDDNCTMAHRDAGGAGAIHIIRLRGEITENRNDFQRTGTLRPRKRVFQQYSTCVDFLEKESDGVAELR